MIVVDTNVMVSLLLGGEHGEEAARLFEQDPEWAAPVILVSELRNVLVGYVRRGTLTPEEARGMIDDAAEALRRRTATVPSDEVLDTALECDLSAYDAEFVVLARTLGVPLVTLDGGFWRGLGCGSGAGGGWRQAMMLGRSVATMGG